MSDKLFSYPLPLMVSAEGELNTEKNPNCLCPNPMAAFFCQTGHMTECHSGLTCDKARCSHLPRYSDGDEKTDYTVETAPKWNVGIWNGEKQIVLMPVFAPSKNDALEIVKYWISQTEELKTQNLSYKIEENDAEILN